MHIVLREAADLMHAERAYLLEVLSDVEVRCHVCADGALHTESLDLREVDEWWCASLDAGVVHYERANPGRAEEGPSVAGGTLGAPPRNGIAARLRGTGTTPHVLVVCDRSFEKETFGSEDVMVMYLIEVMHQGGAGRRNARRGKAEGQGRRRAS